MQLLNSVANILSDVKKAQLAQLDASNATRKQFDAEYTKVQKQKKKTGGGIVGALRTPSFLEGLLKALGGLIKIAIIIPALKWLGQSRK